ncbi:Spo0B C-terminal domain-containing protein [Litoribacterium kuwaitense]|uniref:Spo0B C-terminal domain-containing protein n=1 Tax=Litoribacterium kuwaitense TaxID=1398745 RepID=UPI001FEC0414|nr:Spo0B C-terminal domain-containing protein [Litoribacterium kuwaitense]
MKNWSHEELIRYYRHDWLNTLQMIRGNLQLNHIDQVERIIDEALFKVVNEEKLFRMKTPRFTEYLVTFSLVPHFCRLDYEVFGDVRAIPDLDQQLCHLFASFMNLIERSVNPNTQPWVSLSLEFTDTVVYCNIAFEGKLTDPRALQKWMTPYKVHQCAQSKEGILSVEMTAHFQIAYRSCK